MSAQRLVPPRANETPRARTYLDVVPEDVKEQISKDWGTRKGETFSAAGKTGLKISQGQSFNKVVTFALEPGYYHLASGMTWIGDVADYDKVHSEVSKLIDGAADTDRRRGCTPLAASNICDWDSAYAKQFDANIALRDAIVSSCIKNDIVLTGGETANLGEQVRRTGMSWTFVLLSRYEGPLDAEAPIRNPMNEALKETFPHIADSERFEVVVINGMALLHVKQESQFVLTSDGTGSKSIVCEQVGEYTDIYDSGAMAGDDAPREGAFPLLMTACVHAETAKGREQIIGYMNAAGRELKTPMIGCTFGMSPELHTYITNATILSEVRGSGLSAKITPGTSIVLLYEEQRSNGITLQRRVLEERWGPEWFNIKAADAIAELKESQPDLPDIPLQDPDVTLGQLVAKHSTPFYRVTSLIPKDLFDSVSCIVNVSSGGLIGKTRRALEPHGVGADYTDPFEAPTLTLLLQAASRDKKSKGAIPDEVAMYTWGCGNGFVFFTNEPERLVDYFSEAGYQARIGGKVIAEPEIRVASRSLDSLKEPLTVVHRYTDKPLG